jgi:hypothetical protein
MSRLSSTNDADGCKGFSNINGILTLCKKESRQHSEVLRGLVPDYEKSLVIVTILGAQSYNSYRSMSGFASALLSLSMAGALSSSLRVSEIGMSKPHALVSLIIACWSGALMAQMTLEIIPAAPRYLEPVYVRINSHQFYGNPYGAKVSMTGNKITVVYFSYPEITSYYYDVELGHFPAGTYSVEVMGTDGSASTQFSVADAPGASFYPRNIPAVNYSDIWWTPSESGWGLSIGQGPTNLLFAVWFVYDTSGKPTWYTLQPGEWINASFYTVYRGPIYKTTGPYFGGPFNPARVGITQVGSGELSFRDSGSGTFGYTVEGVTGTKAIVRMPIE